MRRADVIGMMQLAAGRDAQALELVQFADRVFVEVPWPNRENQKRFLMPSFIEQLHKDAVVLLVQNETTAKLLPEGNVLDARCVPSPLGELFPNIPFVVVTADVPCSPLVLGTHLLFEMYQHKMARSSASLGAQLFDVPFVSEEERLCRHSHDAHTLWMAQAGDMVSASYERLVGHRREFLKLHDLRSMDQDRKARQTFYAVWNAVEAKLGEPRSASEDRIREVHLRNVVLSWLVGVDERASIFKRKLMDRLAHSQLAHLVQAAIHEHEMQSVAQHKSTMVH